MNDAWAKRDKYDMQQLGTMENLVSFFCRISVIAKTLHTKYNTHNPTSADHFLVLRLFWILNYGLLDTDGLFKKMILEMYIYKT
jgi:hypothetical protein